jgi:hypothetical protein
MLSQTAVLHTIFFFLRLVLLTLLFIFFDDIANVLSSLFKNKRVSSKLKKFAIDHDFPLLSNVVIQIRENKFIKIEHVLFGNKFIYVITSKCYYGYLCANTSDEKWLLYRKDKLIHLDNPLKNNEKRIRILANLLDDKMENFVNVVFLSRPVVASKIISSKERELVLLEDDFAKSIEKYEKSTNLNDFTVKSIEDATKKIYQYHSESLINFKKMNDKKSKNI